MQEQELNQADFEVLALKKGLEILQKENRFPNFKLKYLDPILPFNKRIIRTEFTTFSQHGIIEWSFMRETPYIMHVPESVKNNPLLNGGGMRPAHPFQVIHYAEFNSVHNMMLLELAIKYPAVGDLPAILEKMIPDLIKGLE